MISDYLKTLPAPQQAQATALYDLLKELLPGAEETFSYGMPAFATDKVLVYFDAQLHHLGFYPTSQPLAAIAPEKLAGFRHSKGALQLPYDRPLPVDLITELVALRLSQGPAPKPEPRKRQKMPADVLQVLQEADLEATFAKRPAYQQNDYLCWLARAKQPATRTRRLDQMLAELAAGDVYMKMPWHGRG